MEINAQSSMLRTNEFIRRKCSKDHLSASKNSPLKHSSIYSSDYQKHRVLKIMEPNIDLAKERNSACKNQTNHIMAMSTVYRSSFQKNEVVPPIKFHQKPSFFLKTESFEPLQSTYNKSQINNQNYAYGPLERGKAKIDNLSVAKYNKMTVKSLYHDSYPDHSKLPSIHANKAQNKRFQNIRNSCDVQALNKF